jgi:hypothetical protein
MKRASRPTPTQPLVLAALTVLLFAAACNMPQSEDSPPTPASNLATQEQPLGGDEGEQTAGSGEIPIMTCPTGEGAADDRAAFDVVYDLAWNPPQGPEINLDETFTFTASYTPSEDIETEEPTGQLTFENVGMQTVTLKIKFPDCFNTDKEVSQDFTLTPTITGACNGGVITIDYKEKWQSGQVMLNCVKDSRICGGSDDCRPIPWYLPFGMGPAGTVSRTFMIDKNFTVSPPKYPIDFVGAGGSGGRTIKLEWLP